MALTDDELIEMYRRMLRIRYFEEDACELLNAGKIAGGVHPSVGEEAAVVGACMALRDSDYISGTHRSHGHPIGKGAAIAPLMAELLGKKTGVCHGRGGSMHLADFSIGSLGESGIVGAGMGLATGAALSATLRRSGQVAVCFFGDGASNEGVFHETLNMAALWKLPVVFFCENNLYAATTPTREASALENIADRASAYGIPGVVVDGQDAIATYEVTFRAVERARAGNGPSLIEAKTYLFRQHVEGFSTANYRPEAEVERWKERDPLGLHRERLLATGVLAASQADAIEAEVREELRRAVEAAVRSDFPDPAEAFAEIYATAIQVLNDERDRARVNQAAEIPATRREIPGMLATVEALHEEMVRDERVIFMGEDVSRFRTTLLADVGTRVWSTPISENGFVGMAVGAAMTGLRPFVDLTVANFIYLPSDQIINQAAKLRYMTGGQCRVPVVIRAAMWHNSAMAAQHSDRPYPMFLNVPGLKVVVPADAGEMKGLVKAAIRDDDPVLIFDEVKMWWEPCLVPDGEYLIPLGVACVKRPGSDVTIVAMGSTVKHALAAADQLAAMGISAEVIDPRTLAPLDRPAILNSVAKTGRLVLVEVANKTNGAAAEIGTMVAEDAFDSLRAPIVRVATPDVFIPFSPLMEGPLYPNAEKIVAAVRRQMDARGRRER